MDLFDEVDYRELHPHDLAMVERIYEVAGLPMTESARNEIKAHLRDHERGKYGKVVYNVREDFGSEPEELRKPFDFYMDRFPIEIEVE